MPVGDNVGVVVAKGHDVDEVEHLQRADRHGDRHHNQDPGQHRAGSTSATGTKAKTGGEIEVVFDLDKMHAFDPDTEQAVTEQRQAVAA